MSGPENPLAFPLPSAVVSDLGVAHANPGMTLRDWFAGQAIPAVIAATAAGQHFPSGFKEGDRTIVDAMAFDAFALADAMLSERERSQ